MDYDGKLRAELFASCANQRDAITLANNVLGWIRKGQATIQEEFDKDHNKDPHLLCAKKFLEQTSVGFQLASAERQPVLVRVQGSVTATVAELFDFFAQAKVEAVEVKDD
jgi:hypothetical protein